MALEKQLEGERRFMVDAASFAAYVDARASGRDELGGFFFPSASDRS